MEELRDHATIWPSWLASVIKRSVRGARILFAHEMNARNAWIIQLPCVLHCPLVTRVYALSPLALGIDAQLRAFVDMQQATSRSAHPRATHRCTPPYMALYSSVTL